MEYPWFMPAVLSIGSIVVLVGVFLIRRARNSGQTKIKQSEQRRKQLQTLLKTQMSKCTNEIDLLTALGGTYMINPKLKIIRAEKKVIDDLGKSLLVSDIEAALRLDRELVGKIKQYRAKPDEYFSQKYFDFLDGSALDEEETVNLVINHPKHGAVILQVNRSNAEKYADQRFGVRYFQFYSGRGLTQRHLVKARSEEICSLSKGKYDAVFDILAYPDLYRLLCDADSRYINDNGFPGGEDSQGAGCGFYFSLRQQETELAAAGSNKQPTKPQGIQWDWRLADEGSGDETAPKRVDIKLDDLLKTGL